MRLNVTVILGGGKVAYNQKTACAYGVAIFDSPKRRQIIQNKAITWPKKHLSPCHPVGKTSIKNSINDHKD
jgi:hypothetical protein